MAGGGGTDAKIAAEMRRISRQQGSESIAVFAIFWPEDQKDERD
jgi:hypothetical protein